MAKEIGIGIIGSGFMGRTYAETTSRYNQNARLVGVSGGSRAEQLAEDYNVLWEASPEAFMQRKDVQAVIITTPESSHLEYTWMAAENGKAVLVEKPLAPDVKTCETMIQLCREKGVVLMVVQSQRFRKAHQLAKEALLEGTLGKVRQIRLTSLLPESFSIPVTEARPWYQDPEGGLFLGQSVHNFDLMHWLADSPPQSVFASVQTFGDHGIPNLSTMAQVEFQNGVWGQLWINLEMPEMTFPHSQFHSQIVTDQGLLDFDGYTHLDKTHEGKWERVYEQPSFDTLNPMDPVRLESYSRQNQAFIDAVLEETTPPVTGEDGKIAVAMSLAALESARTGNPVSLS